jgi:sigma-B regulation protein RsbU (phosphoserine phosphatase)
VRARLLLVDDDAGMLHATERILRGPYEVTSALSGEQALEHAGREPYDLAIVDIRMPHMDGFEIMARLQAIRPGLAVILVTGSTTDTDARLTRAIRENAFFFLSKPFHRDVLLALVQRCLAARELADENQRYVARLEHELGAARVFQRSLLPADGVAPAGVEVACLYEPRDELCGDFYDLAARDGRLTLVVADVAGHGAAAAMHTGMIKSAFQAGVEAGEGPAALLERMAASSRLLPPDRHSTALCARLDTTSGVLELASAGHPPAYVLRAGRAPERFDATGTVIHPALPPMAWPVRTATLAPGDRLLACTDGVVEAPRAADTELYGLPRLEGRLAGLPAGSASALIAAVRDDVRAFQAGRVGDDDLTIVALRRRG